MVNILNKTIMFQRFIDDIVWLSYGEECHNKLIINVLTDCLIIQVFHFKSINTSNPDSKLEFLDIKHQTSPLIQPGFFTRDFIKVLITIIPLTRKQFSILYPRKCNLHIFNLSKIQIFFSAQKIFTQFFYSSIIFIFRYVCKRYI